LIPIAQGSAGAAVARVASGIALNEHTEDDGATVFPARLLAVESWKNVSLSKEQGEADGIAGKSREAGQLILVPPCIRPLLQPCSSLQSRLASPLLSL
jgi:hypothetical protein